MTMSISLRSSIASPGAKMLIAFRLIAAAVAAAVPVALPGCPEACGNITIPYPFGIGDGCFRAGFALTCDETHHTPRLFVGHAGGVQVVDISLRGGTVRVLSKPLNGTSDQHLNGSWSAGLAEAGPLAVSTTHNVFVSVGCDVLASLLVANHDAHDPSSTHKSVSICAALCVDGYQLVTSPDGPDADDDGTSCSGISCCQTSISQGSSSYRIQLQHLSLQSAYKTLDFRIAAFIVEQEWFAAHVTVIRQHLFSQSPYAIATPDGTTMPGGAVNTTTAGVVPTILEWGLHKDRDDDLILFDPEMGWRCLSLNSFAVTFEHGVVLCNCSDGFEGNPYIAHGCQDVNECEQPDIYPCHHGTCINVPGTYRCLSKRSIISLPGLITVISISIGFGLLFLLLGVAKITNKLKKQRAKKLRQKFFKQNHGLLLQQLMSTNKYIAERMNIFSLEELEQATNKFHHNRIIGGGGHGTVYKGILSDQRVVAIKKSKIVVQKEIDDFINEVVILSQINHRNVVKLFGCCLETEVPLLVYEFISNGTLAYHVHEQSENPLSWKDRLRIALETARAIAYLHSAASISVFHRDIKCANILLTDALTTKVSDFGASRSISIDDTGIVTVIQGTHGYLDPEYYYTSRLTEKSDVYSFGVILAELLTRVKPVFYSHSSGEGTSLAFYFVSLIRDDRLSDILDPQIVEEGGAQDAEVVARLAETCLSLKGEERPTMRQVETTLEDVQSSKVHLNSQITRVNQNIPIDLSCNGSKGIEGTRQYSLEKEFIESSEFPR